MLHVVLGVFGIPTTVDAASGATGLLLGLSPRGLLAVSTLIAVRRARHYCALQMQRKQRAEFQVKVRRRGNFTVIIGITYAMERACIELYMFLAYGDLKAHGTRE